MEHPINFVDQLSQHLKSFRRIRGLTQAQLAAELGVSQSRIADIEGNPGKMSVANLVKILAALDVRLLLQDGLGVDVESSTPVRPGPAAAESTVQGW